VEDRNAEDDHDAYETAAQRLWRNAGGLSIDRSFQQQDSSSISAPQGDAWTNSLPSMIDLAKSSAVFRSIPTTRSME
jgi:hypothetical protein